MSGIATFNIVVSSAMMNMTIAMGMSGSHDSPFWASDVCTKATYLHRIRVELDHSSFI
jgi:hypothetical protein